MLNDRHKLWDSKMEHFDEPGQIHLLNSLSQCLNMQLAAANSNSNSEFAVDYCFNYFSILRWIWIWSHFRHGTNSGKTLPSINSLMKTWRTHQIVRKLETVEHKHFTIFILLKRVKDLRLYTDSKVTEWNLCCLVVFIWCFKPNARQMTM